MKNILFGSILLLLLTAAGSVSALRNTGSAWVPPASSAGSNISLTLNAVLLEKAVEGLLPTIDKIGNNLTIPATSTEHFSFDAFKLEGFAVGNFTTGFAPNPSGGLGADITVGLDNLQVTIPHTHFCVYTKIFGIKASCCGDFYGEMSGTNIALGLALDEQADGKLHVADATSSGQFGSLQIHHWFANFFCKVGEDIIQIFIGSIDKLIQKIIVQDLPSKIGPILQDALNKKLPNLPVKFNGQPLALDDSLTLRVEIMPPGPLLNKEATETKKKEVVTPPTSVTGKTSSSGQEVVKAHRGAPHHHQKKKNNLEQWTPIIDNMDVAIEINDLSINDLLLKTMPVHLNVTLPTLNTTVFEKSYPAFYQQCPGCPFSLDLDMTKQSPLIILNEANGGDISLVIRQMLIGFNALDTSTGKFVDFFDTSMNATFSIEDIHITTAASNNRLLFKLNVTEMFFKVESSVAPLGFDLPKIMAWLIERVLIPEFDQHFEGIPLPNFGKVITGLKTVVTDHNLAFGIDLNVEGQK